LHTHTHTHTQSSQFNHVESNDHILHAMLCAKHPAMFSW